jgi:tripartite-type tricarboxylate transporter receptor subunit TctC
MAAVARAEPDGYTILVNSATHSLVPVTYQNLSFDTFRDLQPLLPLGNSPMVMMVNPAKGYTSVADFVTRAKAAKGSISYSGGGIGSIPHLAAEAFRLAAGFDGVNVPFKGAPEALNEVLAGRLDFYFSPLPPALPLLQANQLQALAVTGSSRSGSLPNVPTVAEAGYTAATYNFWIGVFVPAKTPPAIANRLYTEIKKALDLPDTKARLATLGVDPLPLDQAEFQALIEKEFATNSRIAKAVGLQPH